MARIIPAFSQFLDDNGEPLINGSLRFLESDSNNTEKATYSDIAQILPNTNPVKLSGAGRSPNVYGEGLYNIVSYDENDQQIEQFDPVGVDTADGAFSDWNSVVIYDAQEIVTGSNGSYYRAITGTNQNNDPITNPANWELIKIIGDWNAAISYGADNAVYGSDGDLYFSIAGSNLNNNPVSSPTLWRFGGLSIVAAGTNTYTATLGISAYTIDKTYNVSFTNTNTTTSSTLNIDSLGAIIILNKKGATLIIGEIPDEAILRYDGTNFILLNSNSVYFRGARAWANSSTALPNGIQTEVLFDSESYDTDSIHSISSNTGQLIVPSGVSKVRVTGQVSFSLMASGSNCQALISNGGVGYANGTDDFISTVVSDTSINLDTGILSVNSGNIFRLYAYQVSGGAETAITGIGKTWFAMEIIE